LAIPWLGYGARCSQRKYVTGVFLDGQWHSDHATTPLDSITGFTGDHDAELIKIQGRLLGHSMQGDDLVLAMETGGAAFTAL